MKKLTAALAAGLVMTGLAGCSAAVVISPADDAANPLCAEVSVTLPQVVAELDQRETNAQATGAWGSPAGVILTCGVPVPDPTATLPCVTVIDGQVDWLRDDSQAPTYIFTTYGRDPAVQVRIDGDVVSGEAALSDLDFAVSRIPAEGKCISVEDSTAG